MGARLRHYRRQAVRPVWEHASPLGRENPSGGVGKGSRWIFGEDSGGENTVYQNVLHEFDAESPDFGAVVESNSFFVGFMFKDWFVIHCRTEALRRAASGWAHGAIKATSVEIFRGY